MKNINLVDIIGKISATSPKSAKLAYDAIEPLLSEGVYITLSFKDIEDCSSAFINAFIGKLYMHFNSNFLDNSLIISDISNIIWEKKINDAKMLGLNENTRIARQENLEQLLM